MPGLQLLLFLSYLGKTNRAGGRGGVKLPPTQIRVKRPDVFLLIVRGHVTIRSYQKKFFSWNHKHFGITGKIIWLWSTFKKKHLGLIMTSLGYTGCQISLSFPKLRVLGSIGLFTTAILEFLLSKIIFSKR